MKKLIAPIIAILVVLAKSLGWDIDEGIITEAVTGIVAIVSIIVTALTVPPTKKDVKQAGTSAALILVLTALLATPFAHTGCKTIEGNQTAKVVLQLAVKGASYAFAQNYPEAAPYLLAATDLLLAESSDRIEARIDAELEELIDDPYYRDVAETFLRLGTAQLESLSRENLTNEEFRAVAAAVRDAMAIAVDRAIAPEGVTDSPVPDPDTIETRTLTIRVL